MAAELLNSEKERAEHIMLVDLERNDIGRIAAYGSVHVPELMTIEKYSHVMHLVSQVEGGLPMVYPFSMSLQPPSWWNDYRRSQSTDHGNY